MSEFVGHAIGSRHYSYPETPRGAAVGGGEFARNFAIGPATATPVTTAGTPIPWEVVTVAGTNPEDVPITPRSTGTLRISGVVSVENDSVNTDDVTVQLRIDGTVFPVPAPMVSTGEGGEGGFSVIPFLFVLVGVPIGVQMILGLVVTSGADSEIGVTAHNSTMDVEEVPLATG
jgi:hypothetical protein